MKKYWPVIAAGGIVAAFLAGLSSQLVWGPDNAVEELSENVVSVLSDGDINVDLSPGTPEH